MDISSPLLNLALLESLKAKEYSDEIDLFIPFIAVTISEIGRPTFTAEDIQEKLFNIFRFKPPLGAIKVLLARCKKRGLVTIANHTYLTNIEAIEVCKNGFSDKRKEISGSLDRLNEAFVLFASDKFNKVIDKNEAEALITKIIEKNAVAFFERELGSLKDLDEKIKNLDYFTASFVSHIHRNDKGLFEDFSKIVKGLLLANFLCLADKATHKKKYSNVTVFLDTPIIVGLLGFNGKQRKIVLQEFLELLRSLHVKIQIFEETYIEAERLLSAWKHDLERMNFKRFNPKTLELLRIEGYDPVRLATEISLLRRSIEALKISIKYGFKANPKYQCDENAFEKMLKKIFSEDKDLHHDISCISHIHNQREEKRIADFGCEFSIFVTPSFPLAKATYQFFFDEVRNSIPLVVSEQWLTAIFWLKTPGLHGSLPLEQMISTAYGLLNTDDRFWRTFISRLESIEKRGDISQDDFDLVRWDAALLNQVHDASVDVGEDFTDSDVFEIIEKVKQRHMDEKAKAVEEIKNEADNVVRQALDSAEAIASQANFERDGVLATLHSIKGNIARVCFKVSGFVSWLITASVVFSVFLVTYASIPKDTFPLISNPEIQKASVFAFALVVSSVFGLLANLFGFNLVFVHGEIRSCIYRVLMSFFVPETKPIKEKEEPRLGP